VLVGLGPLLILLALGLAFTIFGDLSALLGMASLGAGITILSRS